MKNTLALFILFAISVYAYNNYATPTLLTKKLDIARLFYARWIIKDIQPMFPPTEKSQTSINYIIIHHDAISHGLFSFTPISAIIQYHNAKFGRFAYHYYIDKQGIIYQTHPQTAVLPHALSYNENSLGICLSGDFMHEYPTPAQLSAYKLLMFLLTTQHPAAKVLGHKETGNQTTCPGNLFEYNIY